MRLEEYVQSGNFQRYLSRHAHRLLSRFPHSSQEIDDLVQVGFLAVWSGRGQHDAARSKPSTFAQRLALWAMQNDLRHRRRQCRDFDARARERFGPDDEDGEAEASARFHARTHSPADEDALRLDLAEILSPDELALGRRLLHATASDIAGEDGVNRSTVGRRVAAIREKLHAAGLAPD